MVEEIMSLKERQQRLSALARADFSRQFHANDAINAIDTLNKIDGIYKQQIEVTHDVVHTFVFLLPDGTKFTPGLPEVKSLPPAIEGEVKETR